MRYKLFNNRYGIDDFSIMLLVLSLLFYRIKYFWVIGVGLVAYAVYRMLSKNILKRRRELAQYQGFIYKQKLMLSETFKPLFAKLKFSLQKLKQRKVYLYLRCPECNRQLRVPRGKGTIRITCPYCGNVFRANSR